MPLMTNPNVLISVILLSAAALVAALWLRNKQVEAEARERIAALNAELERTRVQLERLDAAKSEFISIAGHQLRAPLTIIKGYASLLLEGTLGDTPRLVKESMEKVSIAANQLVRLVSDLLDLSRVEAGRMRYDLTRVGLSGVVAEVVREFEETARAKGLILLYQNRVEADVAVNGDPGKLREIVVNLVDNAIQYTASGQVVAEIYTQERVGRRWLTLKVQDTGIGIKTADLAKMFMKFSRTEEARRLRPGGMGLGLYIVKRIIDDHGGEVTVASPGLGQGSTFSVTLPVL